MTRTAVRVIGGAAAGLLTVGVVTIGVRAGTEPAGAATARLDAARLQVERLDEARRRAAAEGRLAALDGLPAELAAARARVEELQRELGEKDATVIDGKPATVMVSGVGRLEGEPDVLAVDVGARVGRPSSREAMNAASAVIARVVAALKRDGVESRDIQSRWVAVHRCTWQCLGAYEATNSVHARVRNMARAGEIIGNASDAGGDEAYLQGVVFDLNDNAALLDRARAAAMADARRKAEQYAALSGRRLGKVLTVSEFVSSPPAATFGVTTSAATAAGGASAVPIQTGSNEVGVTVVVAFVLRD